MIVADCWCFDIEDLLNQLGSIFLRGLQENDMANPPLSRDVLMEQLAAQPQVLLCVCFWKGHFVMVPLNLTCLHCLQRSFS